MLREIKGTQRLPRVLAFRVDGTGTASILEGAFDATLTDNGTGDYTLTFAKPFARVPVVLGASILAASGVVEIDAISATAIGIKTFAVDGTTATDVDFHVALLGFDSADQT